MGVAVAGLDTPRGDGDVGYQGDRGAVPGPGTLTPLVWGSQGCTAPRGRDDGIGLGALGLGSPWGVV